MSMSSGSMQQRIEAVRSRIAIDDVIGRVVKLGRGAKPRGKCPFHGSKSDSFAVDPANGRARCWGCGWSGDAIEFVRDFFSLGFRDAIERLEAEHGLDGLSAAPLRRIKLDRPKRGTPAVDSSVYGRYLWDTARPDHDAVRVYFRSRGIPDNVLIDERLRDLRFLALAPVCAWRQDRRPDSVPQAPAIVALVRLAGSWKPIGIHATFLRPDLAGKMDRRREDGSSYPARKMLGASARGCVALGRPVGNVPLFVGEGLETVFSGMALTCAPDDACGLAALSLDNLQGKPLLVRGALPLHDPQVDPNTPGIAFPHGGPVTALIDADMKPLRGPRDPQTGEYRGLPVIERRRGPIVRRAITQFERSALCSALVTQSWRALGCRASAFRPRMGQDFNDAIREASA